MKASPVSGRLYTRKIRQLDKPVGRNSGAETPPFRVTGLEIGERFTADRVDKKIARCTVQSLIDCGKAVAEFFKLSDVHDALAQQQRDC